MTISKENKRHLLIGIVLAVAAFIVWWYWRTDGQVVYQQDPTSAAVPDQTGDAAPGAIPGYVGYNVPPFNPGALPPITYNTGGSPNVTNNGVGCCPGCAGDDIGITQDIGMYYGLGGLGNYAGAA